MTTARKQFREMFPIYQKQGYALNWNPTTKKFYLWKDGQIFINGIETILSFPVSNGTLNAQNVEHNISILENKIKQNSEIVEA